MRRRSSHKATLGAVRKLIKVLGGTCNVTHQVGRVYGTPGIPDLYIQMPDRAFWVEVKVGRDRLTPDQAAFKAREEGRTPAGVVLVGGIEQVFEHLGLDSQRRPKGVKVWMS